MPDPCPEPCGCYTRTFITGRDNVISDKNTLVNFCPLHKAAPALVDLLRQIDQALSYEDEVRLGLVPCMKEARRLLPPLLSKDEPV